MKMILDLPRDLLMEIFSRVPLKSMREVRITCKKLNTLSKNQSFSKLHLAKEEAAREGEYRSVVLLDYNLSLMSVTVDEDASTEPKAELSGLNQQVKISQVFHCDGLLLCILKDHTKIVVWNPYSGQTRRIEPRCTHPKIRGYDKYRYALGYANEKNTSHRSLKFLRFLDHMFINVRELFQWYEIYDLDTDQWTTLDVPDDWRVSPYGVSLKGNTYFCATKANSRYMLSDHFICFDYTRESFGPLMRMPFSLGRDDFVTLSCVREERLAVLLKHNEMNPYEVEVWITTKIKPEEVTWSKFLTLNMGPQYYPEPITFGGFFIDEGKKVAMGFGLDYDWTHHTLSIVGENGYLKQLKLKEYGVKNVCSRQVCSYVPSLVQLKQPKGGKRKQQQQSSSEQLRYDEKLSRLVQLSLGATRRRAVKGVNV